jgi:hypothetical protein
VWFLCPERINQHGVLRREEEYTYYNTREMSIQYTAVLVIPTMHLQEMRPEVLHDRLVVISTVTERGDADQSMSKKRSSRKIEVGQITHYF